MTPLQYSISLVGKVFKDQLLKFRLLASCKGAVTFVTMCNVGRHFCEEK